MGRRKVFGLFWSSDTRRVMGHVWFAFVLLSYRNTQLLLISDHAKDLWEESDLQVSPKCGWELHSLLLYGLWSQHFVLFSHHCLFFSVGYCLFLPQRLWLNFNGVNVWRHWECFLCECYLWWHERLWLFWWFVDVVSVKWRHRVSPSLWVQVRTVRIAVTGLPFNHLLQGTHQHHSH